MKSAIIILGAMLGVFAPSFGQSSNNVDSLFRVAQSLAFSAQYEESRMLTAQIISNHPAHRDAALLQAKTYLWENNFDQGLSEMRQIIRVDSNLAGAWQSLFDGYLWSEQADAALALLDTLPLVFRRKLPFILIEARVFNALARYQESLALTEMLIVRDPNLPGIQRLHQNNLQNIQKQHLLLDYQYSNFNEDIPNWHWLAIEYGLQLKNGPLLLRATQISRFNLTSSQVELEYYPRLNEKTSLYAGLGLGQGVLFPSYRAGLEIFRMLPAAMEWSAGLRHIEFADASVTSYTASLSKYYKNFWFNFRPFIIPTGGNLYLTYSVQARRYFKSSRHWLSLSAGLGNSPDMDFRLNRPDLQTSDQIFLLDAFVVRIDYQLPIRFSWIARPFIEWKNEEFLPSLYRRRLTSGISFQRFF